MVMANNRIFIEKYKFHFFISFMLGFLLSNVNNCYTKFLTIIPATIDFIGYGYFFNFIKILLKEIFHFIVLKNYANNKILCIFKKLPKFVF